MSGYDKNQERKLAMQDLGKDLARRAKSKCELCENSGLKLQPYEPPPVEDDPSLARTLLLCERCAGAADGGKIGDANEWRFLADIVWTEFAPAQVVTIRLLRRLVKEAKADWARDTLEMVSLGEETQNWLDD